MVGEAEEGCQTATSCEESRPEAARSEESEQEWRHHRCGAQTAIRNDEEAVARAEEGESGERVTNRLRSQFCVASGVPSLTIFIRAIVYGKRVVIPVWCNCFASLHFAVMALGTLPLVDFVIPVIDDVVALTAHIYLPIAVDAEVVRRSQKASRHKFTTLS
jgi:hypothetical protein